MNERQDLAGPPGEPPGLGDLLSEWAANAGERVRSTFQLALAETRLAAVSLGLMVFLMVLAAGCVLLAWGLLVTAAVYALQLAGARLLVALGVLVAVHLLLAWLLWQGATRVSRNMGFEATRRELGGEEQDDDLDG